MAKLTLNDIVTGYQSADSYNANNALIEDALENTLSLDGTTPNSMTADLDINSNDVNNVATLNATSLVASAITLNGVALSTTTTLTGGLAASEVTYDSGALSTKLDDEFPKLADAETVTGVWTFSGATHSVQALTATSAYVPTITMTEVIMQEGNSTGRDWYISRNLTDNDTGNPTYTATGDGICEFSMRTDTLDGLIKIRAGDNDQSAGTAINDAAWNAGIQINGSTLTPSVLLQIDGVTKATVNSTGLTASNQPGSYSAGNALAATIEAGDGVNTATYTTQNGSFTQIGNVCHFAITLQLSALGDMTIGANTVRLHLNEAPDAADSLGVFPVMAQNLDTASFLATDSLVGYFSAANNEIILMNYSTTAGATPLTTDELTATSHIRVSGSYFTS